MNPATNSRLERVHPILPTTHQAAGAAAPVCDAARTGALLDFRSLVDAIEVAMLDCAAGRIASPPRMVVPMSDDGLMLSMPACAPDIAIHKLVNVNARNAAIGLPILHGHVAAYDARTGVPLFTLDGPTVTGRRTAAVSLLAMRTLLARAPNEILLIGTGQQARHHVDAFATPYPDATVWVRGARPESAEEFCASPRWSRLRLVPFIESGIPNSVQVVVCVTTSRTPVVSEPPAAGRLVIGVGAFRPEMAEIAPAILHGSDVYVDDPLGARHEAGDLLQAGIDWSRVRPLADALRSAPDFARPMVFKSVGTAAWDLAACRVARDALMRDASGPPPDAFANY